MAEQYSPEDIAVIQWAHDNPNDPRAKDVITKYQSDTSPQIQHQYTNDNSITNQEAPPRFSPIEVKSAENAPTSPILPDFKTIGESAGKIAAGSAIGAAELANPLSAPHGIETLGRAAYKYATTPKSFFDSISEGDKESVTAPMTLRQVAPIIRTLVTKGYQGAKGAVTGDSSENLADIYDREVAAQEKFQGDPFVQNSQTATELGGAALSIGALARDLAKAPAITQTLTKLKGLSALKNTEIKEGLNLSILKKSSELQRKLLGDLPKELQTALYQNTKEVRDLLSGSAESRSALSTVQKIRESLKNNFELLGDSVGEFRKALATDRPDSFDTSLLVKKIDGFLSSQTLSGGEAVLEPRETGTLLKFKKLLQNTRLDPVENPKGLPSKEFDTRDAAIMIDKIDDYLKNQGYYEGKNVTSMNKNLFEIRDSIDSELANKYPAFKEMKLRYKDFIENYRQVSSRIDGLGAEGFVNNLFGKNKTETRQLLEGLLNRGDETKNAFRNVVKDSDNISSTNKLYNDAIVNLKTKADNINFVSGKEVMNEIANKAMARKLAEISDPAADHLRSLIDSYVLRNQQKISGAIQTAGATTGMFIGNKAGSPAMGSIVGWLMSQGASKFAQGIAEPILQDRAQKMYSLEKLFNYVEKDKKASQQSKGLASGVKWIWNNFGPDAAESFLNKAGLTMEMKSDLDRALYGLGGMQGLLKTETGNFGDNIKKQMPDKNSFYKKVGEQ
jgi:hypothetical protein